MNIENSLKSKIKAIKIYKDELKPYPHSRSLKGLKNLNKIRGNQCGLKYAEAFEIIRVIEKVNEKNYNCMFKAVVFQNQKLRILLKKTK